MSCRPSPPPLPRDEILITLSSTLPKERVVGLNRIWELVQREVNMHACDDHTLSCVRLALSDQNWDVGGAAARVVWKMAGEDRRNKDAEAPCCQPSIHFLARRRRTPHKLISLYSSPQSTLKLTRNSPPPMPLSCSSTTS
jgi:hypothetical protein